MGLRPIELANDGVTLAIAKVATASPLTSHASHLLGRCNTPSVCLRSISVSFRPLSARTWPRIRMQSVGGCPGSRRTLNGGPPASSAPVGSVRGVNKSARTGEPSDVDDEPAVAHGELLAQARSVGIEGARGPHQPPHSLDSPGRAEDVGHVSKPAARCMRRGSERPSARNPGIKPNGPPDRSGAPTGSQGGETFTVLSGRGLRKVRL